MPELATTMAGVARGHTALSAGNVIGSDIFNILGVLGVAGILHPMSLDPAARASLLALTGMVMVVFLMMRSGWKVSRVEGLALVTLARAALGAGLRHPTPVSRTSASVGPHGRRRACAPTPRDAPTASTSTTPAPPSCRRRCWPRCRTTWSWRPASADTRPRPKPPPAIEAPTRRWPDLLGTHPHNVAFTEHATAAFVQALSTIPLQAGRRARSPRAATTSPTRSSISPWPIGCGIEVLRAPDAPEGGVDLQAMEELIHRRRPRLVAVTHVPTNSGLVQDVAAIGRMCRARDILYLVDACQSVGQMPVHPDDIGCDFLSATARKFLRGPRGRGLPLGLRPCPGRWAAAALPGPARRRLDRR